eukprot:gb/GECG01000140.1/.p1 GENE.gb/GECG01000140.1/~~gb/GECG01000140.1/.p1  ORF type:complete len:209 (+),score=44.37 gb/GECG01000140.1/:1-627(+)
MMMIIRRHGLHKGPKTRTASFLEATSYWSRIMSSIPSYTRTPKFYSPIPVHPAGARRLSAAAAAAAASAGGEYPEYSPIQMPRLSPTMEKGTLAKWNKQEGDALNPGDILAEVETDKATVDFEWQEEGYLAKILVPEGTPDVPLGKIVAIMVEEKEDVKAFKDLLEDDLGGGEVSNTAAEVPEPEATETEETNPAEEFAGELVDYFSP